MPLVAGNRIERDEPDSPDGPRAIAVGRPRDPAIDEAVLAATRAVLVELGYSKLTFDLVARRCRCVSPDDLPAMAVQGASRARSDLQPIGAVVAARYRRFRGRRPLDAAPVVRVATRRPRYAPRCRVSSSICIQIRRCARACSTVSSNPSAGISRISSTRGDRAWRSTRRYRRRRALRRSLRRVDTASDRAWTRRSRVRGRGRRSRRAGHASRKETLMDDVLVRGGTVVDGTGAPARPADVRVRDGVIVEVGADLGPTANRRSTPRARTSSPASSTRTRTSTARCGGIPLSTRCRRTATRSLVFGNCGNSIAPLAGSAARRGRRPALLPRGPAGRGVPPRDPVDVGAMARVHDAPWRANPTTAQRRSATSGTSRCAPT